MEADVVGDVGVSDAHADKKDAMTITNDDHRDWLDAVESDGVNLSTWETDFIESLRRQVDAGRTLSEKQGEILERIYAEKTP
jgi:hypothetical protein